MTQTNLKVISSHLQGVPEGYWCPDHFDAHSCRSSGHPGYGRRQGLEGRYGDGDNRCHADAVPRRQSRRAGDVPELFTGWWQRLEGRDGDRGGLADGLRHEQAGSLGLGLQEGESASVS
jgi:hypothetical protein